MEHLNIRAERIKREWTLEYVGNEVGVTKVSIYDIETGKSKPSYDVLLKLLKLFSVDHEELSQLFLPVETTQTNSTTPQAPEDIDLAATQLADMTSTDVMLGARDLQDGTADTEHGKKLLDLTKKVTGKAA